MSPDSGRGLDLEASPLAWLPHIAAGYGPFQVAPIALMEDVVQGVAVIRSVAGLVGCVSRMPCHRHG